MNRLCLCYAIEFVPSKAPSLHTQSQTRPRSSDLTHSFHQNLKSSFLPLYEPQFRSVSHSWRRQTINASATDYAGSAAMSDIDMVRTKEGVYTAKPKKVVVLWDLDNKPPRGPPYSAAMALKKVAQRFGEVVEMSAYANRHAFIHLPNWVLEERRERRQLDILERKGVVTPTEPYICSVCGRKCKTNLDLKKHFKQLHERERQKKLNRLKSLKGKKRLRYKQRFIDGNEKYIEAAKTLVKPKVGYGLAQELRRAGVNVKTVEDKPQSADWALKRQMQHSMTRGVDWLVLVSDDSDFADMLRRAGEANLGTVVVGDWDRALGRYADLWVPWIGVENGEIGEEDLIPKWKRESEYLNRDNESFSVAEFDGQVTRSNMDSLVDELVALRTDFHNMDIPAYSKEGEDDDDENLVNEEQSPDSDEDSDFLLDSDDEDDNVYFR